MTRALWLECGTTPVEHVRLVLCRDVYHCRPSELRQERLADVLVDLTCVGEENRIERIKARNATFRAGK